MTNTSLSFRFSPKWQNDEIAVIEELSYHLFKLYNIVKYTFMEEGYKSYYKTEPVYRTNWHREYLHSHIYQQGLSYWTRTSVLYH